MLKRCGIKGPTPLPVIGNYLQMAKLVGLLINNNYFITKHCTTIIVLFLETKSAVLLLPIQDLWTCIRVSWLYHWLGLRSPDCDQPIRSGRTFTVVILNCHNPFGHITFRFRFYVGSTPWILVLDPELIKQITVKDFDSFMDRLVSNTIYSKLTGVY